MSNSVFSDIVFLLLFMFMALLDPSEHGKGEEPEPKYTLMVFELSPLKNPWHVDFDGLEKVVGIKLGQDYHYNTALHNKEDKVIFTPSVDGQRVMVLVKNTLVKNIDFIFQIAGGNGQVGSSHSFTLSVSKPALAETETFTTVLGADNHWGVKYDDY